MEFGTQELEQVWERRPSPGRRRHEGQWKDPPRGIPKVPLEVGKSGVPDWRRLDLLGRPEVKRPIVRSARGMELLPEEGAADWRDIRV